MDAYFLSDLHLTSVEERNSQKLLRFLTSLADEAKPGTSVFLLGDIFDLWLSDHRVFQKKWEPLLEQLQRLRQASCEIHYFEGNHDLHLQPYWADVLGARVYTGAQLFQLGPWRVRCEHGDEINREDLAYLRLRAFVRHPVMEFLAHHLPGVFWDRLGQVLSKESRKHSSSERIEHQEQLRQMIRDHAQREWELEPFDLIVSGHMHVRDDWSFERGGRRVRSINLGSWFDEAQVLVLTEAGASWRSL